MARFGQPPTTDRRRALLGIGALATVVRIVNLGSFSLWLDEILEATQASGSLAALSASLVRDAVHPPLEPTLTWVLLHLGWGEQMRRLLPIACGVAAVVFLAGWAADRFGCRVGILTGLLAALSPVHVQYSQELRPYSLALLLLVLALWCMQRFLAGSGRRWFGWSWVACLGCLYSQYFAGIVVVPLFVMLWVDRAGDDPESRRALRWMPAFCGMLLLAFLPWLLVASAGLGRASEAGAMTWTWHKAAQRLDHLTIGGKEGDPASIVLVGVGLLLAAGVASGLRYRKTWAVVVGALGGSIGIEVVLHIGDHWSNTRYSLNSWPFLVILLALGIEQLGCFVSATRIRNVVIVCVTGGFCLLQLGGLHRYYEVGRPDWKATAHAVQAVVRPGDTLWTTNEWTKICLSYYLAENRRSVISPTSLDGHLPQADTSCTYVVAGGYPRHKLLDSWLAQRSQLLVDPGGLGTRLYRVTPFDPDLACAWNLPSTLARPLQAALSFGADARRYFVAGWSHLESPHEGPSFVWALNAEASLALGGLPRADYHLEIDLWPLQRPEEVQRVEVVLNHLSLGEFDLQPGRQTLEALVPAAVVDRHENVVRLRFAYSTMPHLLDPRNEDRRALSAAFEHLRLVPR